MAQLPPYVSGPMGVIRYAKQLSDAKLDEFSTPDARRFNLEDPETDPATAPPDRAYILDPATPLSAHDSGATCTIKVESFTVKWEDLDPVVYVEASIGNLAHEVEYHVYVIDNDRDGTPDSCYFATEDRVDVIGQGIIYLGSIKTPAPLQAPTTTPSSIGGGGVTVPPQECTANYARGYPAYLCE
jgi:hypothetical protein